MQFDEQKDLVTMERILRVVFIDPERQSSVSQTSLQIVLVQVYGVSVW